MELTVDQALQQGVAAHKEGKVQDAERLYRAILQSQPLHPDANHNLGVLAVSVNKANAALPLFKTALEANPKIEQFWLSYIDALIKEKQFENAKEVLEQAKTQGVSKEKLDVLAMLIAPIAHLDEPKSAVQNKSLSFSKERKKLSEQKKKKKKARKKDLKADNPSQEQQNYLLELYQNGKFLDAEKLAIHITEEFPKHQFAWKVLGAVLVATGRNSEAVDAKQTAVALSPQDARAHYNLGVTLQELGRLIEAEASYTRAIALKPDFVEAHNNLGNTLQEQEKIEDALAAFNQAIALRPDYAQAQSNIIELLTSHTPKIKSSKPIISVDREIKELYLRDDTPGVLSNDKIINLFDKASNVIKKYGLDLRTTLSQTYRRNSVDLNCNRHMQIFNKYKIIPKFCFGCYKVQVEPRSLLELMKLFVVFDRIKLNENNTRKCWVEMRPEISGFYKGVIYCSSLEEAYQIADYLEIIVKEKFGSEVPVAVKRGCSEYYTVFSDYKEINKSGAQLMNYNDDWKAVEVKYDSKNPTKSKGVIRQSLCCLSLSDVLILRNWIDYAKGIGDSSAKLFKQNEVNSQKIFNVAKARQNTYFWREPS